MLRNRKTGRVSGLDEYDVAASLAITNPAGTFEGPHGAVPGNYGQARHLRGDLYLAYFDG